MRAGGLSLFDKLIYFFNLIAVIALLCTYTAPHIKPETFWFPAALALGYPYTLMLNLLFTAYWVWRKKWRQFLYMVIVLALGYNMLAKTFAFQTGSNLPPTPPAAGTQQVKVMSYNVRNFDLYNWKDNIPARDRMLNLIRKENPDIICFQEFYTEDKGELHNVKLLVNELGYKYYHFEKTLTLRGKDHWGEAIFSKYPLQNPDKIVFSNSTGNIVAYADADINGKTVRIFNAHLQSFKLANKEVQHINDISGGSAPETLVFGILAKLRNGFVKRSAQARILQDYIQKSPYPVIVCGDFNDVPASYAYHTISKNLHDAFLLGDFGFGNTYNGLLPTLRIDYILLSKQFTPYDFYIINKNYSDHYAVICTIEI